MVKYKKNGTWYEANDSVITARKPLSNSPVTCVYKHVDEVTRRTVEHVTEVVHSDDNMNSDDQLFSDEGVTEVVDSDENMNSDYKLSSDEGVTEVVDSDDNINSDVQLSSDEDVPEVVNSDANIISDVELSSVGDSVKDVTEVVDSDSHLSEEDIVAENISKKDKPVNIIKTVKKQIMKSVRRKKCNTSVCPDKLPPQSPVRTGSQYQLKRKNVLCFCKTTSHKCRYCNKPTCNFCCVGNTAEEADKRVCLKLECSTKYIPE